MSPRGSPGGGKCPPPPPPGFVCPPLSAFGGSARCCIDCPPGSRCRPRPMPSAWSPGENGDLCTGGPAALATAGVAPGRRSRRCTTRWPGPPQRTWPPRCRGSAPRRTGPPWRHLTACAPKPGSSARSRRACRTRSPPPRWMCINSVGVARRIRLVPGRSLSGEEGRGRSCLGEGGSDREQGGGERREGTER
jgi:hypothetical protein